MKPKLPDSEVRIPAITTKQGFAASMPFVNTINEFPVEIGDILYAAMTLEFLRVEMSRDTEGFYSGEAIFTTKTTSLMPSDFEELKNSLSL